MKGARTFNKETVYSDVDITNPKVTFLKYMGKEDGVPLFKFIGGEIGYLTENNPKYGVHIRIGSEPRLYIVPDEQVQELIKSGKITD